MSDELNKSIEDLGAEFKSIQERLEKVTVDHDDIKAAKDELEQIKTARVEDEKKRDAMVEQLAEVKAILRDNHGKSGANDWRNEFQNFIKAAYHDKHGLRKPEWLTKATGDLVTDVDASGGYLVPRGVADSVVDLTLVSGNIWPILDKFVMPAGMSIRSPWPSTQASVGWRRGATGLPGQGTVAGQMDPVPVFGADTIFPDWIRGWQPIANEAFTAPGISLPDTIAMQLTEQIVRRIERAVIRGYDGTATQNTDATDPKDGILYAANVNTQTPMATVTYALVKTFIGECLAAHEGAADVNGNYIVTTPAVAHVLKGNMTQTGITWGDPGTGYGERLHGYRFLTHPYVNRVRTTDERDYIVLSPLQKIRVGWSGQFFVNFNDSVEFTSNNTLLLVSTHADYGLGNPDMHHCGSFTALA